MTVRIRLTSPFYERIAGVTSVEVSAATVESALRVLTDRYPELTPLIWADSGTINPVVALFLNDQMVVSEGMSGALKPGDQIDVIMAISGG